MRPLTRSTACSLSTGAASQSVGMRTKTREPPALPMITSCSCSESRLSRMRPVTSRGSTPAAPLKSSSSSTVKRSCNGGSGDRSMPAGSEAASAAIARATATPIPSSAPSVVPGACTHPSATTGKTPSTAGSVPAPASASQTMSRCAWRTTVSASDDPGTSATTLPTRSALATRPSFPRRSRTCARTCPSSLERRGSAASAANSCHTVAGSSPPIHASRSTSPGTVCFDTGSSSRPALKSAAEPRRRGDHQSRQRKPGHGHVSPATHPHPGRR